MNFLSNLFITIALAWMFNTFYYFRRSNRFLRFLIRHITLNDIVELILFSIASSESLFINILHITKLAKFWFSIFLCVFFSYMKHVLFRLLFFI